MYCSGDYHSRYAYAATASSAGRQDLDAVGESQRAKESHGCAMMMSAGEHNTAHWRVVHNT